jgi:hypothetical protein
MPAGSVGRLPAGRGKAGWPSLAISAALSLLSFQPVRAQVPIQVLDTGVQPNGTPDIAFDLNDQIVVSYYHAGQTSLKLARGSGCAQIETLYDAGMPGLFSSVAVDSLGLPNVVHYATGDGWPNGVRYTLVGGGLFGTHTVNVTVDGPGYAPVFDLDSSDRPWIVYRETTNQPPRVARFDIPSGEWVSEPLPGPEMIRTTEDRYATVAVDGQDRPVVAYYSTENRVVLARRESGGWTIRMHDLTVPPASVGSPALAFDTVDTPHVACPLGDRIVVLRFGILSVTTQTAVNVGMPVISPHAMAIDAANRIRIAYEDFADHHAYLAMNEFGWSSTFLDATGAAPPFVTPAVALDSLGRWAVAYVDRQAGELKVAGLDVTGVRRGDLNCDGLIDGADVQPFVLALVDQTAYAAAYPDCDIAAADLNCDGMINCLDVQPFVPLTLGL